MSAPGKMRAAMGMLLLGPSLAVANGTEPAVPSPQPVPVQMAPAAPREGAPAGPVWLQGVPVVGAQAVYWVPSSGMVWPVPPQYPAPMANPPAAAAMWTPFVLILVPMQAVSPASAPAEVKPGPVTAMPAVKLPSSEASPGSPPPPAPAPAAMQGAVLAPAVSEPAKPDEGVALKDPKVGPLEAAGLPFATDAPVPAPVLPASLATVDYGPVAPTPVVDLLALEQQLAATQPRRLIRAAPKPVPKPSANAGPPPVSPAPDKPVRKRLCWTKGVVAPCR